jgi:mRNA interferase MazF
LKPGDIVIAAFPGAHLTKTRPTVVLSTSEYHRERPDVILGLITTKPADIPCSTDYEIQDWELAGLHSPSHFRLYLVTLLQRDVRVIGHLTQRDWEAVKVRVSTGLIGS